MAETIESFVSKLQAEGVEAGRRSAARIVEEAEETARGIIREAEARAAEILERASVDAAATRDRTTKELRLAVRDTIFGAREALVRAVRGVLRTGLAKEMKDPDFLRRVLHDLILEYARADSIGDGSVTVRTSYDMSRELAAWATGELRSSLNGSGVNVDLVGTLREGGFEYRISDGTVDVTVESVVEAMGRIVQPRLRDMMRASLDGASGVGECPP